MPLPAPDPSTTVVVTGASAGIGEALARELAAGGHGVTLIARREARLEALAAELRTDFGVEADVVVADLASARARARAVAAVRAAGRPVVGLCNNAGQGRFGLFHEEDPAGLRSLVSLNVDAVHELTRAFLPAMVERGEGAILNVASILGHGPVPGNASYSASKAFVITLSEAIHTELLGTGVSCTAFSPGPVRTEGIAPSGVEEVMGTTPDLIWAEPSDVARAGVRAMREGRRTAIPGLGNQLFTLGSRYLPRTVTLPLGQAAARWRTR